MIYINGTSCCGMDEIQTIFGSHPKTVIHDVLKNYYFGENRHSDSYKIVPFIIFSGTKAQKAEELCNYIRKNKLGKVLRSDSRLNPNSGNMLRSYIWQTSDRGLREYAKKIRFHIPTRK